MEPQSFDPAGDTAPIILTDPLDEREPRRSASPMRHVRNGVAEIIKTLLVVVIVLAIARVFLLPFEVEGASMSPNLHDQDRVLVNRSVYFHFDLNRLLNLLPGVEREGELIVFPFHMPQRGDVVVLHPPFSSSQPYIKRVIGLPGETITFRNGYVYVDGVRLDEPYINGAITRCDRGRPCYEGTVPPGRVYVLGDNRGNSTDSRSFGPVPIDNIIGEAWFTNWPLDAIGFLPNYDYGELSRDT